MDKAEAVVLDADMDAVAEMVIVLYAAVVAAALQGAVMSAEEMYRLPLYAA
jgi:hypothetical protein